MKKVFYFLLVMLLLSSCKNDNGSIINNDYDDPNSQFIPRIYGTMPVDKKPTVSTRGVARLSKVWNKPMAEEYLTVKFLNGSAAYKTFVKETVKEWQKYAGVRFEFVDDDEEALIRIGFDYNRATSSWAMIGTDHLAVVDKQDEPTINYVLWRRSSDEIKRNDVLRTFGQVLGLELEYRHPKFDPQWTASEEEIRSYWEDELDGYIPWDELKKIVLDPIESSELIYSTREYDASSIMSWAFYYQIAQNLPALDFDEKPITELSDNDKAFVKELYGPSLGDLYPPSRYYDLIEFDYSGTTVTLTLSTTKDIAVIWDKEAKIASYIEANGSTVTRTLTYTYPEAATRHITIAEFLKRGEQQPEFSTALQYFDLATGGQAYNIDIKRNNKDIKYIRIIGGPEFKSHKFNFTNFDNLEELYLVQTKDSKLSVQNCPKLHSLGTSRFIWRPTKISGPHTSSVSGPIVDTTYLSVVGPDVSWPAVEDSQWPQHAEPTYSLKDDEQGVGLTIKNCNALRNLSLENVAIRTFDFSNIPSVDYVYISSTKHFIVGCHATNTTALNAGGHALSAAIETLPNKKTAISPGIITIRLIESTISEQTNNYIPASININYFNKINTNVDNLNWYVVWDSGCQPFTPRGNWWQKI